jgi:peptidoglycan/LPS O-acetylase OafA/YrhL
MLLVTGRAAFLSRILSWRPLVWIGTISYGLYLWHGAIFWAFGQNNWGNGNTVVLHILAFALSFGAASISYYLVEKRFLRLKDRFGRARTSIAVKPEPVAAQQA